MHTSVTGSTLLFPVIGHPVEQVQAPALFNPLLAQAGIDAIVVPLDLPPEGVLEACKSLLCSASVGGLLVTVPYKQTLHALADRHGEQAQVTSAVNALRRLPSGEVAGDLFDGIGFVSGLRAGGHEPSGCRVLLVGAGGAGSAIAAALLDAGVASLAIFDRSRDRSLALRDALLRRRPGAVVEVAAQPRDDAASVVVNATPLGLRPDDPLPIDPSTLVPGTLVAEIIMRPEQTRLMRLAHERGCVVHPGRPMLDHQLPAYLRFFGLDGAAALASRSLGARAHSGSR
jgi:shikimate dehydrogenase